MKLAENRMITKADWSTKPYWYLDCGMCSTFPEAFDKCGSNYEVESILRKHKVIRKDSKTDTESCALVVIFSTEKAGVNFIGRLNKFLEKVYTMKSNPKKTRSALDKYLASED
jgi:hypothetical protein